MCQKWVEGVGVLRIQPDTHPLGHTFSSPHSFATFKIQDGSHMYTYILSTGSSLNIPAMCASGTECFISTLVN